MDKRVAAMICAAALTFWLFALAFGSAAGAGVHAGNTVTKTSAAAMADAEQISQTEPDTLAGDVTAQAGFQTGTAQQNPAPQSGTAGQTAQPPADAKPGIDPAAPALELPCRAAILIDQQSGTVLYEKNADEAMPIASITKVMTLLLTFEALHANKITYEDHVPVSEHGYSMGGSQIWLEPGEQFTLHELLKAICVSSANDAAVVVAEYVGGSEPSFVSQMNAKAAELGMKNTTFKNACGLDEPGHLSSARDVSIMSRQILNECPEVLKYTGIWMDTLRGGQTQLINTNKLLKHYNGITGLKTGTTSGAGVCISATATRDGLSLIAVVLGSSNSKERFISATTLLDYGFSNYEAAALPAVPDAPLSCNVRGGSLESVSLDYSALPPSMLLKKGQGKNLTARSDIPEKVDAPLVQGDTIGMIQIFSDDTLLGEYPVTAGQTVDKLTLGSAFRLLLENLVQP
jgi:D-alanyl-D-alanine carboxypeptidase (penicillin-binding protein 5/6)